METNLAWRISLIFSGVAGAGIVPTFSINTVMIVHLEITIKSKGRVSW
jgi:hypothetical protein